MILVDSAFFAVISIPANKWVDVADDAVKIGLGALIGFATSFFSHRLSRKQALTNRRQELIEKVSGDFEDCHNAFVTMFAGRAGALKGIHPVGSPYWHLGEEGLKAMDDIGSAFKKIIALEGRLVLARSPKSAETLKGYRGVGVEMNNKVAEAGPDAEPIWFGLVKKLNDARDAFQVQLREDYEKV